MEDKPAVILYSYSYWWNAPGQMWLVNCFNPFCLSTWGQSLNDTLNDHTNTHFSGVNKLILRVSRYEVHGISQSSHKCPWHSMIPEFLHSGWWSMLQVIFGSGVPGISGVPGWNLLRSDKVQRDTFGFCILYLLKIKNRGRAATWAMKNTNVDWFWQGWKKQLLYWGEAWVICCGKAMNIIYICTYVYVILYDICMCINQTVQWYGIGAFFTAHLMIWGVPLPCYIYIIILYVNIYCSV